MKLKRIYVPLRLPSRAFTLKKKISSFLVLAEFHSFIIAEFISIVINNNMYDITLIINNN